MSEESGDYRINCSFCGKTHTPVWGKNKVQLMASPAIKPMNVPYTCPVTGNKGEVTYEFSFEIFQKSIIGWKD